MTRPSGARCFIGRFDLGLPPRSVTANTSPRRFEAVSSGPKSKKFVPDSRHHVAQERSEHPGRFPRFDPRRLHFDGVLAEIGQHEVAQQRVRRLRADSHSSGARPWGNGGELRTQAALIVEELFGR